MRLVPLLTLLLATSVAAQTAPTPGACTTGTAEATITPGRVEASVFNTGALFFGNRLTNGDGYIVPRGSGTSPIFSATLWLAGTVGGELRAVAPRYTNFAFWPGPLGSGGTAPADCAAYDRIYRVTRADVAAYVAGSAPTADLRDWPATLGAPVLDGDGVAGNYNLAGGDQPALRGDEVAWWLMNDVGNVHRDLYLTPGSPPFGVEARVEAYGFDAPPLDETTFYRYTLTNRTAHPIDSVYAGFYVDADLGDASDDYIGSDTLTGLSFTYNADNNDGGSVGYGVAPPAIGVQVTRGPVGLPNGRDDDRDGATDEPGEPLFTTAAPLVYKSGTSATYGEPGTAEAVLRRLRGLWGDGTPVRAFGDGYGEMQGSVTRYAYPGDPVSGQAWSEVNNGSASPVNPPSDRRMLVSTGPFRLAPGASETVTFAFPYARGSSNLDSVTRLRALANGIRSLFTDGDLEPVRIGAGSLIPVSQAVRLSRPFPNPTSGRATVTYEMPTGTRLRATLHDVLGRELAVLADGPTAAATGELTIDGARLAPGVYRVRVVVPAGEQMLQFVVTR